MTIPSIVSGAVSTVTELGKDEAWLQGWLKDQPDRLGLGELTVADGDPVQDEDGNPAFLAADEEDRYFSVDVLLGEMEASQGFGLLHNWARNRVRHPDKTHVAVLVTEDVGDRYRATLEALAEHLPLVVVELQAWRGETEAIIVPHVALKSDDVELVAAPAVRAAEAISRIVEPADTTEPAGADDEDAAADGEAEVEAEAITLSDDEPEPEPEIPENKDDTGVLDPWGLPKDDGLLTKIGS